MPRKKDIEGQLAECDAKLRYVKAENHDLKADLKATHALLLQAQKKAQTTIASLDFTAALEVVADGITAEITASAGSPRRLSALETIRKGLKVL